MNRELEKSASYFYVNRISFDGRKPGMPGMLYDKSLHHTLLEIMKRNKDVCWDDVEVVTCNCYFENMYTTENVISMWTNACNLARTYNFTIIYQIGCTKFVVSPDSPIDLMERIMDKPSFYNKEYNYNDLQLYGKFEDVNCNADIIINLALKTVGPKSMPRITKQYFEYMMTTNSFKTIVNGLNDEIAKMYKDIAKFKFSTYRKLNKNRGIIDDPMLESLSGKLKGWSNNLWKVINGIFDNYHYFTNRNSDTMYNGNCWQLIMDELNFMFKYYVCDNLNGKSIDCILSILTYIAKEKGIATDPFEDLKNKKWNDESYISDVCKNILKY